MIFFRVFFIIQTNFCICLGCKKKYLSWPLSFNSLHCIKHMSRGMEYVIVLYFNEICWSIRLTLSLFKRSFPTTLSLCLHVIALFSRRSELIQKLKDFVNHFFGLFYSFLILKARFSQLIFLCALKSYLLYRFCSCF